MCIRDRVVPGLSTAATSGVPVPPEEAPQAAELPSEMRSVTTPLGASAAPPRSFDPDTSSRGARELTPVPRSSGSANAVSRLNVTLRESRLLRTNLDVASVSSADNTICEVVQVSPREVVLVGKKPGSTRVDFWCGVNKQLRATYEVAVTATDMAAERAQDQYLRLGKLVRDLYPDSHVSIQPEGGTLVVSGSAKDKHEAIAIISMIRRMRTIPVVDKIVVERR